VRLAEEVVATMCLKGKDTLLLQVALGFVALGELHFMKHVPVASLTRHIKTEIT
jgi:hypothetical protein